LWLGESFDEIRIEDVHLVGKKIFTLAKSLYWEDLAPAVSHRFRDSVKIKLPENSNPNALEVFASIFDENLKSRIEIPEKRESIISDLTDFQKALSGT